VAFYVLAALGLNVLMDRWCPAAFEKVYRIKWQGLCQLAGDEPDRPLVVMVGSSRTEGAFQAELLEGLPGPNGRSLTAYNFGVPAAGPIHEYLYLREMLGQGIRPHLLLVEFLPPLFNDAKSRLISEENWTIPEWASATQMVHMAPYFVRPVRKGRIWLESRLAPWYVYRLPLHNWVWCHWDPANDLAPDPYPHDRWGCRYAEPLTDAERARRWRIARQYVPSLRQFRTGAEPIRAMHDLLKCCRREQIPVVLVLTPESAAFRSWYSPECLAVMADLLGELRTTYGVEVIDARQWLEDDDEFMDGHHLQESGARKFTTRLIAEVRHHLQ
jgi:hypothetical protein